MVYAAGSPSLAMLELLVHLSAPELLSQCVLFEVSLDASLMTSVEIKRLPRDWRASPPRAPVQRIGDAWLDEARFAVLRVPSAIVPHEWNFALNPLHPDFGRIWQGAGRELWLDPRLIK